MRAGVSIIQIRGPEREREVDFLRKKRLLVVKKGHWLP
jgi:hypothetical protein